MFEKNKPFKMKNLILLSIATLMINYESNSQTIDFAHFFYKNVRVDTVITNNETTLSVKNQLSVYAEVTPTEHFDKIKIQIGTDSSSLNLFDRVFSLSSPITEAGILVFEPQPIGYHFSSLFLTYSEEYYAKITLLDSSNNPLATSRTLVIK